MGEWFSYDDQNGFEGVADPKTALDAASELLGHVCENWWRYKVSLLDINVEDIRAGVVLWRPMIADIPEAERQVGGPSQRWVMALDTEALEALRGMVPTRPTMEDIRAAVAATVATERVQDALVDLIEGDGPDTTRDAEVRRLVALVAAIFEVPRE